MNKWWKNACVYQVYPTSFKDSSGTGSGDIPGITEKLDYLENLGIDVIWLSPVYKSPMADNGYDISDYYDINPMFGTMEDMDRLIKEAHKRNIKIIMDLVVNHTSDQHKWFKSALSDVKSPYRDYYIWRDNKGDLPNNMDSIFGGPAWTLDEKSNQYYMHLFAKEQPDLNWENDKVRKDVYKMMNWWLSKGIAGFRMDVIDLIGKVPDEKITDNGPMLHTYLKEMNQATYKGSDVLTVGECWGATVDTAQKFSNPDGTELSMVFQFHHIMLRWKDGNKWDTKALDLDAFKSVIEEWQKGLHNKGWNSLFLGNHDLPRSVSYWGNDTSYRVESAKMLASLLHGLQGTPYIYQGEEIGMTNIGFDNLEDYRDIESLNHYEIATKAGVSHEDAINSLKKIGRDNARTPMQWNASENAGFTDGQPWIKVNPNHKDINVEAALQDENSIFYHYKNLIALRKTHNVITDGTFDFIHRDAKNIFAYKRENADERLYCINNFSENTVKIPLDFDPRVLKLVSHNYESMKHSEGEVTLRPYESLMLIENL